MTNVDLDKKCIDLFFKNDRVRKGPTQHLSEDIKSYLENRYSDSDSLIETLYRIKLKIEKRPVCKTCGDKVRFYKRKFNTYCSRKCAMNDKDNIDKIQKLRNEHIEHFKKNYKQTCLQKYGIKNVYQSKTVKDKIKITCLKKYGNEYYTCTDEMKNKSKETCLKKYGVEYSWQADEIKKHSKETCLKRYGVEIPMQSKEKKDKLNASKLINHSFSTSKPEEECFNMLTEKFTNVKRQYNSKLYPFNCDFYIPKLDLYIEYQGSWTHGNHPFDKTNTSDINILNIWKNKNTDYYNNAINIWTIKDPLKRKTAKTNNINLLEIWSLDEMKKWINSYKE